MKLVLFSRNNCHLCDAFEEELKVFLSDTEMDYQKINIDSQQALITLYGNDVPVLSLENKTICQHFFDKDKILKVIK